MYGSLGSFEMHQKINNRSLDAPRAFPQEICKFSVFFWDRRSFRSGKFVFRGVWLEIAIRLQMELDQKRSPAVSRPRLSFLLMSSLMQPDLSSWTRESINLNRTLVSPLCVHLLYSKVDRGTVHSVRQRRSGLANNDGICLP